MTQVLAKWLWEDGRWRLIAWLIGVPLAAFWIYSGMPMICHG